MKECAQNHGACSEQSATQDDSRPARLLDLKTIQRNNESGIKLVETVSGSSYRYACLSHRFDDAVKRHQTTTSNFSEAQQFINLENLPKNWRDAVSIARDLDIEYLWIDSVCIVQDSAEDWYRVSVNMSRIYGNSFCNIAATSSADGAEGCFRPRNKRLLEAFVVKIPYGQQTVIPFRKPAGALLSQSRFGTATSEGMGCSGTHSLPSSPTFRSRSTFLGV